MTEYVYHARFISEDTNPWDGNESFGVWRTLEDAQEKAFAVFSTMRDGEGVWTCRDWDGKIAETYTGHESVNTWEYVDKPDDGEEATMSGEGFGFFIFKEPLR